MWGRSLTETNSIQNFNFGFSTYKSDILVHLSQWQYWWWFWFTLLWTVYLFVILGVVQRRTYQFNPVINTSIRGHGKWGDFLIAIIPLSWCGNILVNSNFILRMIEWQNESSLFTIRVQGKQWYWVYKYDASAAQAILTAPKNIGHNNWFIHAGGESFCADTYYQALQLGTQLEFNQLYLNMLNDKKLEKHTLTNDLTTSQLVKSTNLGINTISTKDLNISKIYLGSAIKKTTITQLWGKYLFNTLREQADTNSKKISLLNTIIALKTKKIGKLLNHQTTLSNDFNFNSIANYRVRYDNILLNSLDMFMGLNTTSPRIFFPNITPYISSLISYDILKGFTVQKNAHNTLTVLEQSQLTHSLFLELLKNNNKKVTLAAHYDYMPIEDTQDFAANKIELSATKPLRILKGILNLHTLELLKNSSEPLTANFLFVPQFEGNDNGMAVKPDHGELLWGFKQKKYKRLQKFKYTGAVEYNPKTFAPLSTRGAPSSLTLKSNLLVGLNEEGVTSANAYNYQKAVKYNRHRSELVPVTLARRLLRTKRTLVLPAHTNITVITNSYDVVHSWFIPGLGIKLDCVPGRSTHHTFYIDNIGFYYGQCAEICGRYHHHMPIRLCALPFEQFLVWWQKRGLKRMHRVRTIKDSAIMNSDKIKFRYQW